MSTMCYLTKNCITENVFRAKFSKTDQNRRIPLSIYQCYIFFEIIDGLT